MAKLKRRRKSNGLGAAPSLHRRVAKLMYGRAYSGAETAITWAESGYCHDAWMSMINAFENRGAATQAAKDGRLSDKQRRTEFKYAWDKMSEAFGIVNARCPLPKGK